MKKEKLRCLSLKLDLSTVSKIESIMVNMNVRTYNEVLRTCLNTNMTINQYYKYSNGIAKNTSNIESIIAVFDKRGE